MPENDYDHRDPTDWAALRERYIETGVLRPTQAGIGQIFTPFHNVAQVPVLRVGRRLPLRSHFQVEGRA